MLWDAGDLEISKGHTRDRNFNFYNLRESRTEIAVNQAIGKAEMPYKEDASRTQEVHQRQVITPQKDVSKFNFVYQFCRAPFLRQIFLFIREFLMTSELLSIMQQN